MGNKVFAGPAEKSVPLVVESRADAAYFPGQIVQMDVGNNDMPVSLGATIGRLLILKENGPGVGGSISTAFAVAAPVQAYVARQGDVYRVRMATGVAMEDGETLLYRGAAGRLIHTPTGTAAPVAVARESKTTQAADELALIEVI